MKRDLIKKLEEWQNEKYHKPLLLLGARQVGKTWLMQEFARTNFEKTAYIRFDRNRRISAIFSESDYNMPELLQQIQAETDMKIEEGKTLLILDEIQECPAALTSLKYFCEDLPNLHVIAAGSLLGVHQHQGTGFPVGKVKTLHLYPMSFREFLMALGKDELLKIIDSRDWKSIRLFNDKLSNLLKIYYFVGGMPEAVKTYVENGDYAAVREIQNNILSDYDNDFSKHVPASLAAKLSLLWNSIPLQLARENKRFMYNIVHKSMRAKDLQEAMNRLQRAGLIYQVPRINTPALPMGMYEDGAFKIFFSDVGLLGAKSDVKPSLLLQANDIFREFKGSLTEQYVQQEMRANGISAPHYWHAETTHTELDFVFQADMAVVPVEVKAEHNTKAKSLINYCRRYSPPVAVRSSMNDYNLSTISNSEDSETTLIDIPLYAIYHIEQECKDALNTIRETSKTS